MYSLITAVAWKLDLLYNEFPLSSVRGFTPLTKPPETTTADVTFVSTVKTAKILQVPNKSCTENVLIYFFNS